MENVILAAVLVAVVAAAVRYLYKAKKRGVSCIGCPYAKDCGKHGCCAKENKQSED